VKAILRTRCGCTKEMEIPNDPPPTWRVPLYTPSRLTVDEALIPEAIRTEIRSFELTSVRRTARYEFTAFYEERA
jgi:hypothetical protein